MFRTFRISIGLCPEIWVNKNPCPGNWGTYCFWSVSAAGAAAVYAAAVLPTLFNFPGKPVKLISSNHTGLTYRCGKIFLPPSRWPWVKVTKLLKQDVNYLVLTIKKEPLIQSLLNLVGISPSSYFPPDKILDKFCQEFLFLAILFFCKILNPFSPVKHSICHILGMVGPIDVK